MPDFSSKGRRSDPRPLDVLLLATGFLAVLFSAYAASDAWADRLRSRAGLDQARRETENLGSRERALRPTRGAEGDLTASQVFFTAEAPPPRVLAELTALLPPNVRLTGVGLTYGQQLELDLRVSAHEAAGYDVFLKRLTESQHFTGVAPGPENRIGEVTASVQAVYRTAAR